MVDVNEAEAVARGLLAAELPRRLRHSAGVAAQADRLAASTESLLMKITVTAAVS